jgi:hypothetical protein
MLDAALDQAADAIEPAYDPRVASKEDRRVLWLQRLEAAVGRAARLTGRWPWKALRVEAGAFEPAAQPIEPGFAERNPLGSAQHLDIKAA